MAAAVSNAVKPSSGRSKPANLPRQSSLVRAFTTDDSDVFGASSKTAMEDKGTHVPGSELAHTMDRKTLPASHHVEDPSVVMRGRMTAPTKERHSKRRSKSVGAPDYNIRLLPAYLHSPGHSSHKKKGDTANKNSCDMPINNVSNTKYVKNKASKDPPECEKMLNTMKGLEFPGSPGTKSEHSLPDRNHAQEQHGDRKSPVTADGISSDAANRRDSSEQKSTLPGHFARKNVQQHGAAAGVNKKLTRKLSRKLTGRMTQRQRQELMLEGEFDEFDETHETRESDNLKSPPDSDEDDGSISDDTDQEFETKIVTRMNLERITEDDATGSDDESNVLEMTKTQRIANELLTTERSYVNKLYLLDQVFHLSIVKENREHHMFPENVIPRIFSNIKSIYQFHNDFLLPQLEKRMAEWKLEPRIGDVMRKFAPFLKLYSEYVKNFDCAMKMINFWTERSPRFSKLLAGLQLVPECGQLTLQHHMLEPIQRVPRYQLLLRDYLKHLQPESVDCQDTEKALELVTLAAIHSNEAMSKIDKFRRLLSVNDRLVGMIDLISPTRELIKEGRIIRISAKDGDHIERYLFLFNDLLLVCQSVPLSIGSKQQFKIKTKMDIQGLQVFEAHNLETPNTFYVQGQQKSVELHTSSVEEKLEWQNAIETVIADYNQKRCFRKASLRLGDRIDKDIIGKVPPVWIKDQETSMCMNCTVCFTTFRRRHHCRACGRVICGKCSSHKAPLPYDGNNVSRVCDACFDTLCPVDHEQPKSLQHEASVRSQQHHQPNQKKASVILQVKGSDPSVISGYMNISCNQKTWVRRWFSVHENFVLYSFKANQDIVALTALPLPGYKVIPMEAKDGSERENMFKVSHSGETKVYYLQTDDESSLQRWVEVLQKVVQLELPAPESPPEAQARSPSLHSYDSNNANTSYEC